MTLYLIADFLNNVFNYNEHILIVYNLFEFIIDFNEFVSEKNKLIREKLNLVFAVEKIDVKWNKLNKDQRYVVKIIINAIENNKFDLSEIFFLNDSNDTRKIFV